MLPTNRTARTVEFAKNKLVKWLMSEPVRRKLRSYAALKLNARLFLRRVVKGPNGSLLEN